MIRAREKERERKQSRPWSIQPFSVFSQGGHSRVLSYPPVLGAGDQQAALGEGAEADALAALTVDGLGFLLKHWV